ncbi:MAG: hypothetical protein J6586_04280 [Snodgrassella sp.]|nr:hypothetical protein [Snodgrassella sp.]
MKEYTAVTKLELSRAKATLTDDRHICGIKIGFESDCCQRYYIRCSHPRSGLMSGFIPPTTAASTTP